MEHTSSAGLLGWEAHPLLISAEALWKNFHEGCSSCDQSVLLHPMVNRIWGELAGLRVWKLVADWKMLWLHQRTLEAQRVVLSSLKNTGDTNRHI